MKRTKKNYRKMLVYMAVLGIVSSAGYALSKLPSSPSQVAMVAIDDQASTNCVSNLSTFAGSGACGEGGFTTYTYSCLSAKTLPVATGTACLDFNQAYAKAVAICGSTCTPPVSSTKPTPRPTPIPVPTHLNRSPYPSPVFSARPSPVASVWPPTPPPTSDPSPLVSCKVEVYKLPLNVPLSSAFMLPQYLVKQTNIAAKPGERYAINMVLTNSKPYALTSGNLKLTAWSTNPQGANAPYTLYSTGANTCTSGYPDKSIRCEVPNMRMQVGETVRPQAYMVVDMNQVKRAESTTVSFKGIYSASLVSCPLVNMVVTPATIKQCFGWGRFHWCRNVVQK